MTHQSREIPLVIGAIRRSFPLDDIALADEFFPAHLAVALIDAVFRSGLRHAEAPEPAAQRYCLRFGLARRRENPHERGNTDGEEETLVRLIERYEALGVQAIAADVFGTRRRFARSAIGRAQCVLRAARALQRIGVVGLSDVRPRNWTAIEGILRAEPWANEATVRLFLMYTGGEGFVLADTPVRAFVADAIGHTSVPPARAVGLVRAASYELILAPRYVDHAIWRRSASASPCPGGSHA